MAATVSVIDITIDNTDKLRLLNGIMSLLSQLRPDWNVSDIALTTFTEGITNTLVGCFISSDFTKEKGVVVRVFGEKTELVINRQQELLTMIMLNRAGCCSEPFATFRNGVAYGFVPGVCMDDKLVRDPHIRRLIMKEMIKMHSVQPTKYLTANELRTYSDPFNPHLFPKLKSFLNLSPDQFPDPVKDNKYRRTIKSKADLLKEVEYMEGVLSHLPSPCVFCHNDLLLKNIVFDERTDKVTFIDFEYGAFNFEAFDIGNHFCEYAGVETVDYRLYPDKEYQMTWLKEYLEEKAVFMGGDPSRITATDIQRLYSFTNKFALMSHLFWGIWGLIQARHSAIEFDYLEFAKSRFDEYFARKKEFLAIPDV